MIKVLIVVGARPNFMKVAPMVRALRQYTDFTFEIVHTGQHYNWNMSGSFISEFGIPEPNYWLRVGSRTHAVQTAMIMEKFESVLLLSKPDIVMVVGDVNSTMACSLVVAKHRWCKLAHIESGLRSFDRDMPEEINRIVTDHLADYNFATTPEDVSNLMKEGLGSTTHLVGDATIDNLLYTLATTSCEGKMPDHPYGVVTLHRPSNVDDPVVLNGILDVLVTLSKDIELIFPVHPRTACQFDMNALSAVSNIQFTEPMTYNNFIHLVNNAKFLITDSGGIQVETTVLNVPCITLRNNTERPFTVTRGTNVLVGNDPVAIHKAARTVLAQEKRVLPQQSELWDGRVCERVIKTIRRYHVQL